MTINIIFIAFKVNSVKLNFLNFKIYCILPSISGWPGGGFPCARRLRGRKGAAGTGPAADHIVNLSYSALEALRKSPIKLKKHIPTKTSPNFV